MTNDLTPSTRADISAIVTTPVANRAAYVDVFRGLLIAHMALDHASLMFNVGRGGEELATSAPVITGLGEFLTRFTGVPVAPGFFFMAGFMVALTSVARVARGIGEHEVTKRLLIRGAVLIAVDAIVMGLPRALMGFYSFMVLSSIGVGIIALAWLRHLPNRILLPAALAVLLLHPLLDLSQWPVALRAIIHEPVRSGAIRSLYPVIPWIAVVVLGFVAGRIVSQRTIDGRTWVRLATLCLALFLAVRLTGGYGNAYDHAGLWTMEFWLFAKYPPDLAFLSWSFACIFAALAILQAVTRHGIPYVLHPFAIFGRVPFFFYVVHFYVLGVAMALMRTRFGLAETYGIWILLLIVMAWPCVWYYRKKTERPNFITRYF